ncbi:hypothetical protein [Staphylococcus pseudintermedius]|uniref:hypothetical protein n=1 Tax=Staphylococcus pseudintermedius TaxID=283734 RepID=UPI001455FDC7|nr:hypothetical protein [Staphylococcus pseudintermedius]
MEEMNMDYLSVEKSEKKEKKEENPTKQQRNKDAQKKQAQQANEVRKRKGKGDIVWKKYGVIRLIYRQWVHPDQIIDL